MPKMRTCLIILLFLMAVSFCQTISKGKAPSSSLVAEAVVDTSLLLFTIIIDLFELSTEKTEMEQLTKEISELKQTLKTGLNFFGVKLNKNHLPKRLFWLHI